MPYGTRGLYLVDELFIVKNDNFRNKFEFQAVYSHFISKLNMALDYPCMKAYKSTFHSSFYLAESKRYVQKYISACWWRPYWISQF